MSIIKKGTDFGPTEQVTSTKLDNLVDNASFTDTSANAVAYTGSTGTCLQGGGLEVTSAGQLQVKDSGITTTKLNDNAVTTAKITDLNVTTAKIAADAITTAKIADNVELGGNPTTTTQSAGNNSTRIATTAYADNASIVKVATFQATNFGISSDFTVQLTEQADPSNIASVSSGVITIGVGTYLIRYYGSVEVTQGDIDIEMRVNGSAVAEHNIGSTNHSLRFDKDFIHSVSSGTDTVSIFIDEINAFTNMTGKNFGVTITKLS
jgi:hypothetical protein|tara:strand:+ start:37 stop:831 length:795 start_codon:yes stop_codon:yes gene_type:complete